MEDLSILSEILVFLVAAVVVAPVFQRLKSSLVLGYLAAGMIIGPNLLGLVQVDQATRALGALGVVFLLFMVGLELTFDRLRVLRRFLLGLGSAQLLVTGTVIGLAAAAFGLPVAVAVLVGGGLALSSTAVVLAMLSERGELTSRTGRVAVAVLLMQDLAVVPLLAVVPAFAGAQGTILTAILATVAKAAVAVIALFAFGRLVLRPLFRVIAVGRSPELFAAVTLTVLLGASLATAAFGLSMAIGGFIAGLLLAETEYRLQVAAEIAPFRGLLLGLFFMTVGIDVDLGLAVEHAGQVLGIAGALVASKAVLLALLARVAGQGWGTALRLGLLLGQGGEFAFILLSLAATTGLMRPENADLLIVAVAVSMMLTPVLAAIGARCERAIEGRSPHPSMDPDRETAEMKDHVIIAGFGRVGESVGRMLSAAKVPWIAVDYNPHRVGEARSQGLPVYFGDASRSEVQRALGAERARSEVITLDEAASAERTVSLVRQCCPHLEIFVRAYDDSWRQRMKQAGATGIVHETAEMSAQLGSAVLRGLGASGELVNTVLQEARSRGGPP